MLAARRLDALANQAMATTDTPKPAWWRPGSYHQVMGGLAPGLQSSKNRVIQRVAEWACETEACSLYFKALRLATDAGLVVGQEIAEEAAMGGLASAANVRHARKADRVVEAVEEALDAMQKAPDGPCFAPGTPVLTPEGRVPIETVAPGDLVLAWDDDVGAAVWAEVLETSETPRRAVLSVELRGPGTLDTLVVTPTHPFWIDGRG